MSGACTSSGPQRVGARQRLRARPAPTSRSAVCSRRRAALVGAELAEHGGEALEARRGRRRSSPRCRPRAPRSRYQRVVASTSASTPPISSSCARAVDALEALDDLPARVGAGDLAGDPEGAHDVGRLGAALGDELRDERRPERVDDRVGVDHADQLAPQRVLVEQVAEALDHGGREVARAGRAPATARRRSPSSPARAPAAAWRRPPAPPAPAAPCPRPARRRSAISSLVGRSSDARSRILNSSSSVIRSS